MLVFAVVLSLGSCIALCCLWSLYIDAIICNKVQANSNKDFIILICSLPLFPLSLSLSSKKFKRNFIFLQRRSNRFPSLALFNGLQ
ncbi:hypothetical protein KFK09_010951 [Dendrobium nobile]|uniref:Uncharacterized protein n=1 Tax=Dendrobium nobile TaxID=94219 RepID=A0A8T3BDL8_DENNO|nr:hypothetical protein KFK09_010951 [Dendrobium nobile]